MAGRFVTLPSMVRHADAPSEPIQPLDELARTIRETCQLHGAFTLRSGAVSDTYFDKYLFESDPSIIDAVVRQMVPLVPPATEILAGLELGGVPLVTLLSAYT